MDRPGPWALAALVIVGGAVAVILLLERSAQPREAATSTTLTTPVTAAPVTDTTGSPPTTVVASRAPPAATQIVTVAGWEGLEPPFGRRWNPATAWTGTELLVWGGDAGGSAFDGSNNPTDTGFAYDPARGSWRSLAESDLCAMGWANGVWTGTEMIVWPSGSVVAAGDCSRSGAYDPVADAWRPLESEFFRVVGSGTSVAWTGELLVAPSAEMAMDPADGSAFGLPSLPRNADDGVFSPPLAHWTGEEVLVLGFDELYAWTPGDPRWVESGSPPILDQPRTSAWDGEELVAVNNEMETARWDGTAWNATDPLPLRFFDCAPVGLSGEVILAVESCGRFAVWDPTRGLFVPIPAPVPVVISPHVWRGGRGFVGGDSIYVIGDGAFRYQLMEDGEGRLELPATMPVGVHFLDRPDGLDLTRSVGPQLIAADGATPVEVMTFVFTDGETACSVATSTYRRADELAGDPAFAAVIVARSGEVVWGFEYSDGDKFTIRLPSRNGSDVIDVSCGTPNETREFAALLWEPVF